MNNKHTGSIQIKGHNFIFYLDGFNLTLISIDQKPIPFNEQTMLSTVIGTTSEGNYIHFFDVVLFPATFQVLSKKLKARAFCYILGNKISSKEELCFSAVSYRGKPVDNYFDPLQKYDKANSVISMVDGSATISLVPFEAVDQSFVLNESEKMHFLINNVGDPNPDNGSLGEVHSCIRISTSGVFEAIDVLNLYRAITSLFSFCSFRKNIEFDEIALKGRNKDDQLETVATFHVFVKEKPTNMPRHCFINHKNVADAIIPLYSFLSIEKKYLQFIPENDHDAATLSYKRYSLTSATFENIFDKYYSDIIADDYPDKRKCVVQDVLNAIKSIDYKEDDEKKSIFVHMQMRLRKDCGKSVSLYSKFKCAFEHFIEIFKEAFPRHDFSNEYIKKTAHYFTEQRNDLFHGELLETDELETRPYTIAVCLIYSMILKKAELSDSSIAVVLKKMFWSYNK